MGLRGPGTTPYHGVQGVNWVRVGVGLVDTFMAPIPSFLSRFLLFFSFSVLTSGVGVRLKVGGG